MAETPVVDTVLGGIGISGAQGSVGFCGVYLITVGARRILFDCGHTGRRRALRERLSESGLAVGDIDTLVLSHAHWDHLQNADLFTGADVIMHPAELRYLDSAPIEDPVTPPWSRAILASARLQPGEDGLELAPGVRVTGLPGHTDGSIGLTVETSFGTAMLTGDAVSSARALRQERCTAVWGSAAAATASMKLVQRTAHMVYPGHDRPFTVVDGAPDEYLIPGWELSDRTS